MQAKAPIFRQKDRGERLTQLSPTFVDTVLKVLLALEPRVAMAAMQTTIISASITAYSTAVGPSSFFRKLTSFFIMLFIVLLRVVSVCGIV